MFGVLFPPHYKEWTDLLCWIETCVWNDPTVSVWLLEESIQYICFSDAALAFFLDLKSDLICCALQRDLISTTFGPRSDSNPSRSSFLKWQVNRGPFRNTVVPPNSELAWQQEQADLLELPLERLCPCSCLTFLWKQCFGKNLSVLCCRSGLSSFTPKQYFFLFSFFITTAVFITTPLMD